MKKLVAYIKYFLWNTVFYKSWLSPNGFHFGVLETYTDLKNWWLLSVLLKISWKDRQILFAVQTYFFNIYIKWAKYEAYVLLFHFEFLLWEKDFFWWREEPKE